MCNIILNVSHPSPVLFVFPKCLCDQNTCVLNVVHGIGSVYAD